MAECKIVGLLDFTATANYIVSVSVSASTEANEVNGELIIGPTVGTVNITGYAQTGIAYSSTGGGTASVNIKYIQKYDCDTDTIYLLFGGGGESSIAGDIGGLATLVNSIGSTESINASIASGPATPYFAATLETGYGLNYTGLPIDFSTSSDAVPSLNITSNDFGIGTAYLKSFSLNYTAGTIPTANYSYIFSPDTNIIALPGGI